MKYFFISSVFRESVACTIIGNRHVHDEAKLVPASEYIMKLITIMSGDLGKLTFTLCLRFG